MDKKNEAAWLECRFEMAMMQKQKVSTLAWSNGIQLLYVRNV